MAETGNPPCGLYRTVAEIGEIRAGRLVYFHNHGDPGPGVFLPSSWKGNRAEFQGTGQGIEIVDAARYLEPLAAEGFYRVLEEFYCCAEQCQLFYSEMLVQLGYEESGKPILFVPQWIDSELKIPAEGSRIDRDRMAKIAPLRVATPEATAGS